MTRTTLGGWLVHVMREADGALSIEEALHVIMDSMKEYFPSQSVAVMLIDDDTKELRIKISRQISYTFVKKFQKSGPGPTAEHVVLEQQPVVLSNVDPSSDIYTDLKLEHDFTSAVLAPIIKNQRGIGYIFCDRRGETPFDDTDLLHLQVLGYLIGNLIEKFELIKMSKKLSSIDDASKALQYKAFVPALATELQRGHTHDYTITLALLSVMAFRKYLETYGIDAAHGLLADIVVLIKKEVRDMDILARFGADEFILCLSGTTEPEARVKLEDIRHKIAEKIMSRGDSPITLSIGAVTIKTAEDRKRSLQDILSTLGKKLMESKSSENGKLCLGEIS